MAHTNNDTGYYIAHFNASFRSSHTFHLLAMLHIFQYMTSTVYHGCARISSNNHIKLLVFRPLLDIPSIFWSCHTGVLVLEQM